MRVSTADPRVGVRVLAPYVARSVQPAPTLACALGAAVLARQVGTGEAPSMLLALLIAAPVALAVGDPMHAVVGPCPTSLRRRLSVRLVALSPLAVLVVLSALAGALSGRVPDHSPTAAPPTVALAVVAVALVASRWWPGTEGTAVGATAASVVVVLALPPPLAVLPAADHWPVWLGLLAAALVSAVAATRDPGG